MMDIKLNEWLIDFKKRLEQLNFMNNSGDFGKKGLWLGGLFYQDAFMTATRQAVAQEKKWSLEELSLEISVGSELGPEDNGYVIKKLTLESAKWSNDQLEYSHELSTSLPDTVFRWVRDKPSSDKISIPVYLNNSRKKLLFSVEVAEGEGSHMLWYQRGAAIAAWSLN